MPRYQNFDTETGRPYDQEEAEREAAKYAAGMGLTQEELRMWAEFHSATGKMPSMGIGRQATQLRKLILERAMSVAGDASEQAHDAMINRYLGEGIGEGISEGLDVEGLMEDDIEDTPRSKKDWYGLVTREDEFGETHTSVWKNAGDREAYERSLERLKKATGYEG